MHTKTYLIECERSGLIKIGKTRHPKNRLSILQTGSTSKLTLVHVFDCDIELPLHDAFKSYRRIGEWFDVKVEDVIDHVGGNMTEFVDRAMSMISDESKSITRKKKAKKDRDEREKYDQEMRAENWISEIKIGERVQFPTMYSKRVARIESLIKKHCEIEGKKIEIHYEKPHNWCRRVA